MINVLLAQFALQVSALENGVVDGWNMLRVLAAGDRVQVWFNPMLPEVGFEGTDPTNRYNSVAELTRTELEGGGCEIL